MPDSERRHQPRRTRRLALALIPPVILLGVLLRSARPDANPETVAGFFVTYAPDTLWAVFIACAVAVIVPHWRPGAIAVVSLAATIAIELTQLIDAPPLSQLRAYPPTRFLLGTQFAWSDVACLITGAALAWLLLLASRRAPAAQKPQPIE